MIYQNRILGFALCLASLAFTSCLKDKDYDNGIIQSVHANSDVPKVIELKLTATNATNVAHLSFANSTTDTTIELIPVNLATDAVAATDIHVTLTQNDALVTAYNEAHTDTTITSTNPNPSGDITHYLVPTLFTVINPGGVVTIPKGSRTGYLSIKFKPSDYLGQTYALAYTITAVAETGYTISGNLQNGIAVINIKNQYDGNYHTTGVRVHPTLGPFPFSYDADLGTINATTVAGKVFADLGEVLTITVNSDNSVTLSADRGPIPTAGGINQYDPATKTFTLSYYYNPGAPRVITETLVLNE